MWFLPADRRSFLFVAPTVAANELREELPPVERQDLRVPHSYMADVVFTMPGKVGDNLCRIPIAYQYGKQHGCRVDVCLDQGSACLMSLLAGEPWVDQVFCTDG